MNDNRNVLKSLFLNERKWRKEIPLRQLKIKVIGRDCEEE